MGIACEIGDETYVEILVEMGADINPNTRISPLLAACKINNTKIAKYLLDKGADPNVRSIALSKEYPIILATSNNNLELVKSLVEHGADVNVKNCSGKTALNSATDPSIIEYLKSKGAF